jgi:hypothetical protein
MIDQNEHTLKENSAFDGQGSEESTIDQLKRLPVDKLKGYGMKSLSPFVDLVHKYQDEINPYFDAVSKGLRSGLDGLQAEDSTEADKVVAGWFTDAADWFGGVRGKLAHPDPQEIYRYLETQARRSPGMMFTTSYLAGVFFGRIGRHIGRHRPSATGAASVSDERIEDLKH